MAGWYDTNREEIAREKNEDMKRKDLQGTRWFSKVPVGKIYFRILPPYNHKGIVLKKIYRHRWQYDGKWNWICPKWMYKSSCPICDSEEVLNNEGLDVSLTPEFKCATNIVIYYYEGNAGFEFVKFMPYIALLPYNWFQSIRDWLTDTQIGKIEDANEGILLLGTRVGTGFSNTKYTLTMTPQRGPLAPSPEIMEQIRSHMYDLDKIWPEPDGEYNGVLANIALNIRNHHLSGGGAGLSKSIGDTSTNPNTANPFDFMKSTVQAPPVNTAPAVNAAPAPLINTSPTQAAVAPSVAPAVASPVAPPVAPSVASPITAPPVTPVAAASFARPEGCPGVHDSNNIKCVICAHEVTCSSLK